MSKTKDMTKRILNVINVPRKICTALLGNKQRARHRMLVGFIFMVTGVLMSKYCSHVDNYIIDVFGDLFGYLIHGTGCVPFIDYLTEVAEGY